MSKKEYEFQLWQQYHAGKQEVLPELIGSLEPLLRGQVNKFKASGLPIESLNSKAKVLAYNALQTYDPAKGTQLNTHITNHLKHLQRYVLNYQNVGKIPEHRGIMISRFLNVSKNLEADLGREPSVIEIADELNWSPVEVERLQTELRQDLTITQGKEDTFFDYSVPLERESEIKEAVKYIYYSVPPEDQKILEYTFGLGGFQKLNKREIADKIGKSEALVRKRQKLLAKKISEVMEFNY